MKVISTKEFVLRSWYSGETKIGFSYVIKQGLLFGEFRGAINLDFKNAKPVESPLL